MYEIWNIEDRYIFENNIFYEKTLNRRDFFCALHACETYILYAPAILVSDFSFTQYKIILGPFVCNYTIGLCDNPSFFRLRNKSTLNLIVLTSMINAKELDDNCSLQSR